MADRRPRSRERNNTGEGKGIFKRGATGNGPVGSGKAFDAIKDSLEKVQEEVRESEESQKRPFGGSGAVRGTTDARYVQAGPVRRGGGLRSLLFIILAVIIIYFVLKSMGFFGTPAPANNNSSNNQGTVVETANNTAENAHPLHHRLCRSPVSCRYREFSAGLQLRRVCLRVR